MSSPQPNTPTPTPTPGPGRRRVRLMIGLGLLLGVPTGGLGIWAITTSADRQAGLEMARAGSFTKAEPLLLKALDRDPNDAEVVEELAKGYTDTNSDRAEELLTRWVTLRPDDSTAIKARMAFYTRHKQTEKAAADARRLVELEPSNVEARRALLKADFDAGHFAEAEEHCRALLEADPRDPGLRADLAQIRNARGDSAGAAAILDQLIAENPRNWRALFARGIMYDEAGDSVKAVELLRKVVAGDRTRQRTGGYQLAMALERAGQPEEAKKVMVEVRRRQDVEVFSDAIKTQPDNLALQARLAERLLEEGFTQDGLSLLQAVLSRDPAFPPAHRVLAAYYERTGKPGLAAEHRQKAGGPVDRPAP